MSARLHGTAKPRSWRDPESDRDAYLLFYERSQQMGWLDVLWAMNDASVDAASAWFQVDALSSMAVQPFMRCCEDVLARLGTYELSSAELLLPVHIVGSAALPSRPTAEWFSDSDPSGRVPVSLNVELPDQPVYAGGTLAEWSLDAIGWLAGFAADVAARHGDLAPLRFTAALA